MTPWTAVHQASLSITNSWSLLKLMSIEPVIPSNHLIPSAVPFSSCLQSFPESGLFSMSLFFPLGDQSIGALASTSVLPSNENPGLISFWMDWLDFLAVQGTVKSLLQHHNSKASSILNVLVCIYQPQTPSPSLCLAPSPLATTSLFSMSVNLFLFCR